jgi:hypothetical protein
MNADARQLLETSAEYLRVISSALRQEGDVNAAGAARDAFLTAQSKWLNQEETHERVVPISTLFYSDGSPGVVEASPNPPTSTADRFRLELVSHGEHLRQVVDAVRQGDAGARARRDLTRALNDLEAAAESFGERDVADFVRDRSAAAERLDATALSALDDLAAVLAAPGAHGERLAARLRELAATRDSAQPATAVSAPDVAARPATPAADHSAFTEPLGEPKPVVIPEPTPEPVTPPRAKTPAQAIMSAASSLIDMSLAALDSLTSAPWIEPEQIPEETIVPIESLLYRGTAALDRAIEIRDELRRSESAADTNALEELFDLLELARAE